MHQGYREKRRTNRSRVFFGGEILTDRAHSPVECHVKNISDDGANIIVLGGGLIPAHFDLFIRKTNEVRHAVVTWNRGRQMGVAYRS